MAVPPQAFKSQQELRVDKAEQLLDIMLLERVKSGLYSDAVVVDLPWLPELTDEVIKAVEPRYQAVGWLHVYLTTDRGNGSYIRFFREA
jgi:hypothetical protein